MIRANTSALAVVCLFVLNTFSTLPARAASLAQVQTEAVGIAGDLESSSAAPLPETVHLTFALKSNAQPNAAEFVASLTNPKSANYHKWLTPQQYGEKFGASLNDVNAVVNYLSKHGFSSIKVWPNRLFISAQTPTTTAQSLFSVSLGEYKRNSLEISRGFSTDYYAPDKLPSVDSTIASKLSGLFGLSNSGQRRAFAVRQLAQPESNPNGGLNPSDLAEIYNGAALQNAGDTGTGVTIGIFSPTHYSTSDVNAFLSYNKITGTHINVVNVNGGATDSINLLEADLDIETVAGQAPGATINVYEGPNDGSFDIFNQMAADDPAIVTESYGADENTVTSAYASSYESIRQQMAAEGISIIVASGDTGAYDSTNQTTVTTSVDATSAYVTSIGGTELDPFTNDTWNGEVAWSYNDGTLGTNSGSGGGLSTFYPQPSWQTGPGVANSHSNGMRQIPDVSTLASTPFYSIYANGSFAAYGGTSTSCQFFGGSLALIVEQVGGKLGNIDPNLYAYGSNDAGIYHDITSGNNGVYTCTPDWDFVTGWGSVDFAKLTLAFENTTLSPTPVHTFSPGLQMFSIPLNFASGVTADEVLNGLVTPSGSPAYVIATYDPTASKYVLSPTAPANVPVPGQGYWARFKSNTGGSLAVNGTAVSAPTYSVNLSPGWNIIGDPYNSAVPINSLLVTTSSGGQVSFASASNTGILQPVFYDYNGTLYVPHGSGDNLNSYDGYWIDVATACTLTFPSP